MRYVYLLFFAFTINSVINHCSAQSIDYSAGNYTLGLAPFPGTLYPNGQAKSTFVFLEFGDGYFASSRRGINSTTVPHQIANLGYTGYQSRLQMYSVYDTIEKPMKYLNIAASNGVANVNQQNFLDAGKSVLITSSSPDDKILPDDKSYTFVITYKIQPGGESAILFKYDMTTSGILLTPAMPAVRTYGNAVASIDPTAKYISFSSLKMDGKEHNIFLTLAVNQSFFEEGAMHYLRAELYKGSSKADVSNRINAKNFFASNNKSMVFDLKPHDPNWLVSIPGCIAYTPGRESHKLMQWLHFDNTGEGSVSTITAKIFIPDGINITATNNEYALGVRSIQLMDSSYSTGNTLRISRINESPEMLLSEGVTAKVWYKAPFLYISIETKTNPPLLDGIVTPNAKTTGNIYISMTTHAGWSSNINSFATVTFEKQPEVYTQASHTYFSSSCPCKCYRKPTFDPKSKPYLQPKYELDYLWDKDK